MRADGRPFSPTVATVMALGSLGSLPSAAANHPPNFVNGSSLINKSLRFSTALDRVIYSMPPPSLRDDSTTEISPHAGYSSRTRPAARHTHGRQARAHHGRGE